MYIHKVYIDIDKGVLGNYQLSNFKVSFILGCHYEEPDFHLRK